MEALREQFSVLIQPPARTFRDTLVLFKGMDEKAADEYIDALNTILNEGIVSQRRFWQSEGWQSTGVVDIWLNQEAEMHAVDDRKVLNVLSDIILQASSVQLI